MAVLQLFYKKYLQNLKYNVKKVAMQGGGGGGGGLSVNCNKSYLSTAVQPLIGRAGLSQKF